MSLVVYFSFHLVSKDGGGCTHLFLWWKQHVARPLEVNSGLQKLFLVGWPGRSPGPSPACGRPHCGPPTWPTTPRKVKRALTTARKSTYNMSQLNFWWGIVGQKSWGGDPVDNRFWINFDSWSLGCRLDKLRTCVIMYFIQTCGIFGPLPPITWCTDSSKFWPDIS